MAWPVPSCHTVSSGYGGRIHPTTGKYKFHGGLDIPGSYGSAIVAANSGKVIWAGNRGDSYGNYVIIDHGGRRIDFVWAFFEGAGKHWTERFPRAADR